MAKARSSTSASAHKVVSEGNNIRDRVKKLTVKTLRERSLSGKDVSNVVHDVLHGVSQGIEDAVPKSQKNVLRQVFDGMGEAVHVAAKESSGAAKSAKERGEKVVKHDATVAAKHIRDANAQFLKAAGTFSKKLTGTARDELNDLVARAKRVAPAVQTAAKNSAKAADGKVGKLGEETVKAGSRVARKSLGGLMMAAGGLLEGLADSINPPKRGGTAKKKSKQSK